MRVICLHHRLGGYSSHHFNEARGLIDEMKRRGRELVLLVNRHAEPEVVSKLKARPVFDDPTFRLEWSFAERSRRFVEMLHAHATRQVRRDDWLMVTIATQLEAHALACWLQDLPRRKKPWVIVYFISDRWNRAGREEYERAAAEFAEVRAAVARLSPEDAHRVLFTAITDALAAELREFIGTEVGVAPMPLPYGRAPKLVQKSSRPRVAILGGTRREKGSHRIPAIIRACRGLVAVEFLVHLTNNTLTAGEMKQLAAIADEPNVIVLPDALSVEEYEAALASADLALFPHEVIPYTKRTSGVFGEAVAFGKPGVVTPGTWMAQQIAAGRAAGVIAESEEPEAYARAIARCVADLEPLTKTAQSVSEAWRNTVSLSAFLDVIEATVAKRAAEEKPARRWWFF